MGCLMRRIRISGILLILFGCSPNTADVSLSTQLSGSPETLPNLLEEESSEKPLRSLELQEIENRVKELLELQQVTLIECESDPGSFIGTAYPAEGKPFSIAVTFDNGRIIRYHASAIPERVSDTRANHVRERIRRRGQIDWAITEKARRGWQHGNFRSAGRDEQIAAMIAIQIGVEKAISDPLDREATLDFIQQNIDSW